MGMGVITVKTVRDRYLVFLHLRFVQCEEVLGEEIGEIGDGEDCVVVDYWVAEFGFHGFLEGGYEAEGDAGATEGLIGYEDF